MADEQIKAEAKRRMQYAGSLTQNGDPGLRRLIEREYVCGFESGALWANERIKSLETALRDAISTYGPQPEIVVTEERIEAWKAVLRSA